MLKIYQLRLYPVAKIALMLNILLNSTGALAIDKDTDFFKQVQDNASYTLEASSLLFPETPDSNILSPVFTQVDPTSLHLIIRQKIQSEAAITDNAWLKFDMHANITSQPGDYSGAFRSPGSEDRNGETLDFNELYVAYEAENFDFTIGKNIIETGFSKYSPTNRFGLFDAINPVNQANPIDPDSIGTWLASIEYPVGDDTLSFTVTPFDERSLLPPSESRWRGTSGDPNFRALQLPYLACSPGLLAQLGLPPCPAGINFLRPYIPGIINTLFGTAIAGTIPVPAAVEEKYHSGSPKNWGYLLQYEGVGDGFDYYGLIHHGPSIYPIWKLNLTNRLEFQKINPLAWSFGGGISVVRDEWNYYAEAIYQHSQGDKDDDFLRYTLGFSYRDTEYANSIGLEEIKPVIELHGDKTVDHQDADLYVLSSSRARPLNNSISARIEIQRNSKVSYSLGSIYNIDDDDYSVVAGYEKRVSDNYKYRLIAVVLDGVRNTHFGRWKNNDHLRLDIEYRF